MQFFRAANIMCEIRQKLDTFMDDLKHGKFIEKGSICIASTSLSLFRILVEDHPWTSAEELMTLVKNEGRALVSRCGQTSQVFIVGNLIRRVLKLIREEASASGEDEEADSLRMSVAASTKRDNLRPRDELKIHVLDGLDELSTELETASEEISKQALQHIHANEVIIFCCYVDDDVKIEEVKIVIT